MDDLLPVNSSLRSADLVFQDVKINLAPEPRVSRRIKTEFTWYETVVTRLGTVEATVSCPGYTDARVSYSLYARDLYSEGPDASSYRRNILIGDVVNGRHRDRLRMRGFNRSTEALWCMNCWNDDIYGNNEGGVNVPAWFAFRHLPGGFVRSLPPCRECNCHFAEDGESNTMDEQPTTTIFSVVMRRDLRLQVEDLLIAAGVAGAASATRMLDDRVSEEMKESIVASVFHPERVEKMSEAHKMAPWDYLEAI